MPDAPSARPAAPAAPRAIRFGTAGRFELEPTERRLRIAGEPVPIGARAFDLLHALAARPGRLVGKGELLDAVWGDLVVEEANLHVQVGHLRRLLGRDVIETVPGRGYRFIAPIEAPVVPAAAAPTQPLGRAGGSAPEAAPTPAPPDLHGRSADLARLETLLRPGACITLVGPAGVGKTSLARAVHARWRGVRHWVDLGGLVQARQLPGALARALAVPLDDTGAATATLRRALAHEPRLVVVDNAEHLVDACAGLLAALADLSTVTWLVTSQCPLAIAGERVQRLEPLSLAAGDDGAVGLLASRIASHDHRFAATDANRPVLEAICAQLDGLPLALEMAAARVPALGLNGVHDALARRFAVLTRHRRDAAGRHRTLHDAIDWSHRLLSPAEQALFRRLGVCAGGFDLALAVAVGAALPDADRAGTDDVDARWATVDALATLVDRSLVAVGPEDPPRYRMLETLRAYALEQLACAVEPVPEEPAVRRRHAEAVLAVFDGWTLGDAAAGARCLAEVENAREAIAWAQVADLAMAARLTAAVMAPTSFSVWRHETTAWLLALEPAMTGAEGLRLPPEVQATWWLELARALVMRRDPRAADVARKAYRSWQPLGRPRRAFVAAVTWVRAPRAAGPDLDAACAALDAEFSGLSAPTVQDRLHAEGARVVAALVRSDDLAALEGRLRVLALAREVGAPDWVDAAESNVVSALNALDRHAEAAARGADLLARIRDRGDGERSGNLPWVYAGLVQALAMTGRVADARALVPAAVHACRRLRTPLLQPALALLAAADGRLDDAARWVGHAREQHARLGLEIERDDARTLARVAERAAAALGAERAAALEAEGRTLDDAGVAALTARLG